MSSTVFRDCFGRQIKVGDVLTIGQRDGNYGRLVIGVVTGFTDSDIQITKFQRGKWREYPHGDSVHVWWLQCDDGDTWREVTSRCSDGNRCFITGMSEADLRQLIVQSVEQGVQ